MYQLEGVKYSFGLNHGKEAVPHVLKRRVVRDYASRCGLKRFIETGTYLGDMVASVSGLFTEIDTIELSPDLHARAVKRFSGKKHIRLHCGDSGVVMQRLVDQLDEATLFWLDAHYSGGITARAAVDTPISNELIAVLRHHIKGHVILIDDARCFVGENSYPTVDQLRELVAQENAPYDLTVESDVIRLVPRSGS